MGRSKIGEVVCKLAVSRPKGIGARQAATRDSGPAPFCRQPGQFLTVRIVDKTSVLNMP